jgi:hypothetical protein
LRYLFGWTVTLAFVFSFTGGGSDSPGALATRFGYWVVHVGTGLLVISCVSAILQRGPCARLPYLLQLALHGIAGAMAFTPFAVLFETWLLVPGGPGEPADWPVQAAQDGWLSASFAELGGLAPSFLGSWLLINLTYLVSSRPAEASTTSPPGPATTALGTTDQAEPAPGSDGLRSRLPQALGTDIIHLRADLNYLHVSTPRGHAMVLYSLARAARELGEVGLIVHRAHWVACAHVARTRRTAQGVVLTLSNGVDVAVSRRRQAEVRNRFGDRYQRG